MGAQGRQSHRVVFVRGEKEGSDPGGEVPTPALCEGGLFPHPTLKFVHTSARKRVHTYAQEPLHIRGPFFVVKGQVQTHKHIHTHCRKLNTMDATLCSLQVFCFFDKPFTFSEKTKAVDIWADRKR